MNKRIVVVILVLGALMLLTSCGSSKASCDAYSETQSLDTTQKT